MSNTKQKKKSENEQSDALSSVLEKIKALLDVQDALVLVGIDGPEVSGVMEDSEGLYREVIPLGDGVHIVLSIGEIETALGAGIHEV